MKPINPQTASLVEQYLTRISELEAENLQLKKEVDVYKCSLERIINSRSGGM